MIKKIALCLILYSITVFSVHAAPFQNGSFEANSVAFQGATTDTLSTSEQDLTGWTIESISGDSLEWIISSHNSSILSGGGNYKIELAGSTATQMRIYQIFDTIPSRQYQVTYYLYGRSSGTNTSRQILVNVKNQNAAGASLFSRTDGPAGDNTWTQYSFTFIATSASSYISFENTVAATQGSFLDLINVVPTATNPSFTNNTRTYVYDPGHEELKAIPGNDMVFMYSLENTGGSPDANTVSMKFNIPATLNFKLNSFTFVDGETVGSMGYDPLFDGQGTGSSGLTCCDVLLGTVEYSNDGLSFGYMPSPIYYNDFGEGYDPNVRAIRITPSGTMADGTSSPTGFRVYYQAQIN